MQTEMSFESKRIPAHAGICILKACSARKISTHSSATDWWHLPVFIDCGSSQTLPTAWPTFFSFQDQQTLLPLRVARTLCTKEVIGTIECRLCRFSIVSRKCCEGSNMIQSTVHCGPTVHRCAGAQASHVAAWIWCLAAKWNLGCVFFFAIALTSPRKTKKSHKLL
jgi:hypothetical protein